MFFIFNRTHTHTITQKQQQQKQPYMNTAEAKEEVRGVWQAASLAIRVQMVDLGLFTNIMNAIS